MADSPDIDALARRYLDLWQDQLAELAADEDLAAAMAEALGLMSTGAAAVAAMTRAATGGTQGQESDEQAATAGGRHQETDGTAAAAPASGDADGRVDDLERRLAELERRLADLEAAAGGGGKRPAPRSRRR